MSENWRYFSYYFLGLLPSLFFGLRFLVQWIASEKKGRSHVTPLFWSLSLAGNAPACMHYFLQVQFLLMLLQVGNGFISWRNLALFQKKKQTKSLRFWLATLSAVALLASLLFFAQCLFLSLPLKLLDAPFSLIHAREVPLFWHLLGSLGCLLFASRFWLQWIVAERSKESTLGTSFWLLSIVGSVTALIYFLHIRDGVSTLNYSFGLIPYIRNMMLSKRAVRQ